MPKRSLMLAGGGLKIAFQAGVLQVLLDEAGLEFDHGDAVSAACFNLAMWTQGMSGTQIADNWRNLDPVSVLDTDLSIGPKLLQAESLLVLDKFRTRVFPDWGIDFAKIRRSQREATFNVYNFSKHELVPVSATDLSEDYLIACASLPIWFPPVHIKGDTYIDAIFNVPCNIDEAIRRGADEIWVIWTTSQSGEWFNGAVNNFFGIFEATTNHVYKQALARITRNNAAIEQGATSEFGRRIEVRELKSEVPVHYLLNFSRDRAGEAVNRGVNFARQWCAENRFSANPAPTPPRPISRPDAGLSFRESASGYFSEGANDFTGGYENGRRNGARIELDVKVHINHLSDFITDPRRTASVTGEVKCRALGGTLSILDGAYNLFVDEGDVHTKKLAYRLRCESAGREYTVSGTKELHDDAGRDALTDPATIQIEVFEGTASLGKGIVRAGAIDFLKHLASFRSDAATLSQKSSDLRRFGTFYLGRLWDVYARGTLPVAPF